MTAPVDNVVAATNVDGDRDRPALSWHSIVRTRKGRFFVNIRRDNGDECVEKRCQKLNPLRPSQNAIALLC